MLKLNSCDLAIFYLRLCALTITIYLYILSLKTKAYKYNRHTHICMYNNCEWSDICQHACICLSSRTVIYICVCVCDFWLTVSLQWLNRIPRLIGTKENYVWEYIVWSQINVKPRKSIWQLGRAEEVSLLSWILAYIFYYFYCFNLLTYL